MKGSSLALALLLSCAAAFGYQQPADPDAAAFESVVARYQALLLRQPRRGTAFDQLYRHYLDAGRLDEFYQRYSDLSEKQPQNAAAQLLFALVCQQRGRNEEALAACKRAAELKPDDYYPAYYQALLLMGLHRDAEAVTAIEQALKLSPPPGETLDLLKRLGRVHARQGHHDRALAAWGKLADAFPDDRFALEELAELLAEEEQFDEAIRRYEQLAKLAQDDLYKKLMVQVEIGQLQVRQGKLKTAIATLEACLEQVQPESWIAGDIRRRIEQIFTRRDDLAGLAEYYAEQLQRRPDDLNLMVRRAAVSAKLGQRDEALQQYRAAIQRAPTRRDLREALIEELIRAEQLEEAIAEASQLVERYPNDVPSHERLGELYLRHGKQTGKSAEAESKALAAWEKIAQIRPNDPTLAVTVADLCRQALGVQSRFKTPEAAENTQPAVAESTLGRAALQYYREAIRRRNEPQFHEYCGDFLFAIGRQQEAVEAWRQMAAPPADTPDNLKRLAEVLVSADEIEPALKAVQDGLTKAKDRADLHVLAADLSSRLKQFDAALTHVDALEKLADSPTAEEAALTKRVEIYLAADRLAAESKKLQAQLAAGPGKLRDVWFASMLAAADRRYAAALELLEQAKQIAPKDGRLVRLGAYIHQQGGDLAGAVRDFRRLAELEPRSRSAHLKEVVTLEMELGRLEQARASAEELLRAAPTNLEAIQLLASVQMRSGQVESAIETLRRAVRSQPRDIDLRLAFARQMAQHQRLEEAIEHFWRAFELAEEAPLKISIAASLADQYLIAARFEELIERLVRLRRAQEDALVPTLCLVEAYLRGEDYVSARRELASLLAQRPKDVQVLGQMVSLSEKLDDNEQAAQYQEQVVELKPDRPNLERLAGLYARLDRKPDEEAVWARIAQHATDAKSLLATLDRAMAQHSPEQVVALASPQWSRRPDDWRFGIRLALALWEAKQQQRAAEVCASILNLLPNEQYEKEALSSTAQASTAFAPRNNPPLLTRISLPMQIRGMLANPDRSYRANYLPHSLADARIVATVVRHEARRLQSQAEEHLVELGAAAKQDNLSAVQQMAWIRFSMNEMQELEPLLEQWIRISPQDPEPRVMQFAAPMYRASAGLRQGTLKDDPQALAQYKERYAWLAEHQGEISRYLAGTYIEVLFANGEEETARAAMPGLIEQAASMDELVRFTSTLRRHSDAKLWEKMFARARALQQQAPASGTNFAYFLQQFLQATIQEKNWPQLISLIGEYVNTTHPTIIRPGMAPSDPATSQRAMLLMSGYASSSSRAQPDKIGRFPSPSSWLDAGRFTSLELASRSLRSAGEEDRLEKLIQQQITAAEGIPKQCWQMAAVCVRWWSGEEEQSLKMLDEFARQTPGNLELAVLRARALASQHEYEQALAAIGDVYTPFGSAAKSLEELRLDLAQRVDNEDASKQAALRLFGMRLSSQEQVQLATAMRRLGLGARSDELLKRAERTAGNNTAQLYQLMRTTAQSDQARGVQLARRLLSQTHRSTQVNSAENNYRVEAYRVLARAGQLQPMIDEALKQLEAAPKSQKLLTDLSDYYTALGNEAQALAMLVRIAEEHPEDADINYRVAQALFRKQKFAEAIDRLSIVWEKNPTQMLNQSYEFGRYYIQAKQTDTLIEHVRKLKGSPALTQNSYAIINLVQNLSNNSLPVDDAIKLYEVALEVSPAEMHGETVRQYGEFLVGKGRKAQAYALYKQGLLPKDEKAPGANTFGNRFVDDNLMTPAIRLADLAVELKKRDELEKELGVDVVSQILRAMLARRSGDEQPLEKLGRRYLSDEKFAASLGQHGETLREELYQCKTKPALEVALEAWQPGGRRVAGGGQVYYSSSSRDSVRLADIAVKLDQQDKARRALLEAMQAPLPPGYNSNNPEQVLQLQLPIAAALQRHAFYLDALTAYEHMLRTDVSSLSESSYARRYTLVQASRGFKECVRLVLDKQADAALAALSSELVKPGESVDIARFLTVTDPQLPDARTSSINEANKPTPPLKYSEQLLPALLDLAKSKGQLAALADQAARQAKALPQNNDLAALELLIAMTGRPAQESSVRLAAWHERATAKVNLAASNATSLLALAALEQAATRELGRNLASAAAKAASVRGYTARQQGLLAAITASAANLEEADTLLEQLLADRKSDPNLLFQVAQQYLDRKQYDKGIPLLAPVWERSPDLLVPRIDQLVVPYAEAGRLEDLARGLSHVTDRNLQSRYSVQFGNVFRRLPAKESHALGAIEVYRALLGISQSSYIPSQFSSYLKKLPATRQTLAAYRKAVLPEERHPGQLRYLADRLLDLAKSQNALDELAAECRQAGKQYPAWAAESELLLALIEARRGNETPLVELAARVGGVGVPPQDTQALLREELAKCSTKPALEAALDLWQQQAALETGSNSLATTHAVALLLKLNQKDKARQLLFDSLNRPINTEGYGNPEEYLAYQEIDRRLSVASQLNQHGFPIDALSVFAAGMDLETAHLQQAIQINNRLKDLGAQAWRILERLPPDEMLQELRSRLTADLAPDLAGFFIVIDAAAATHPGQDAKTAPETLLPKLLEHAQKKGQLAAVAKELEAARKKFPDALALGELAVLVSTAKGDLPTAAAELDAIVLRLEKEPALAQGSSHWLVLRTALAHEATRAQGQRLAEAIAAAAARQGLRTRQEAAITLLAESYHAAGEPKKAAEVLKRLSGGKGNDGQSMLAAARILARQKKHAEAVAALATAWKSDASLLLGNLKEVADLYVQAGQAKALAKELQAIEDLQLREQFANEVQNAIETIAQQDKHTDAAVALLRAMLDFHANTRQQAATRLTALLISKQRQAEALDVYRQVVLPPSGSADRLAPSAPAMVDLARQLNKLPEIEAATKAAVQNHPRWRYNGELLIALSQQRQGNEDALLALAKEYRSSSACRAALGSSTSLLRAELAKCKTKELLELAAELWEADLARQRSLSSGSGNYRSGDGLAQIYLKLGKPDKAREIWLAALDMPLPNYSGDYATYMDFQRREYVAQQLASARFDLDAARLYAGLLAIDADALKSYGTATRLTAAKAAFKKSLHVLMSKQLDPTQAALTASLAAGRGPLDLDLYFTLVPGAWSAAELQALPEHTRQKAPSRVELLPAILRHAKSKGSLEQLAVAAQAATSRNGSHRQLAALVALIQLSSGDAQAATPALKALADRLPVDAALASRAETLLVMMAALEAESTRAMGREILRRAFEAASSHKDTAAQAALLERIGPADRSWLESELPGLVEPQAAAIQAKQLFDEAESLARAGDWKQASQTFQQALKLDPSDHWHWYRSSALCLQLDDEAAYRRHCQEVLKRFGDSPNSTIRRRTAQLFCIRPKMIDNLDRVLDLAEPAAQTAWPLLIAGESYYRAGRHKDALEALLAARPGTAGLYHQTLALAFTAMTQQALGNKAAARRSLDEAKATLAQLPAPGSEQNVSWHDVIFGRLACQEAESLLGEK